MLVREDAAKPDVDEILKQRWHSSPTPTHLIQNADSSLADLIKVDPLALLQSPQVQDALARWTYTAKWSDDPALRKQALGFLDSCLPRKMGNPGKATTDLPKLLLAYDDLCAYCKRIFAASETGLGVSNLLKLFPDVVELHHHGLTLDEIVERKFTRPFPSDIAASHIAAFSGLSASRITDLITKARALSSSGR